MTLYDDLGVAQSADEDTIKRAYRKKAQQHHPDKGGCQEKFRKIQHAYDVLSDDERRERYDATGNETPMPNIREKAALLLQELLSEGIDKINIKTNNLIELAKQQVIEKKDSLHKEKLKFQKKIEKREEVICRMKCASCDNNTMRMIIDGDIAAIKNEMDKIDWVIAVFEEMLSMLKPYEYKTDPRQPGDEGDKKFTQNPEERLYAALESLFSGL
jgi:curved DNA-binding protein CbpA